MTPEQAHTLYRDYIAQELLLDRDLLGRHTYKTVDIIAALDRADERLERMFVLAHAGKLSVTTPTK